MRVDEFQKDKGYVSQVYLLLDSREHLIKQYKAVRDCKQPKPGLRIIINGYLKTDPALHNAVAPVVLAELQRCIEETDAKLVELGFDEPHTMATLKKVKQ